MSNYKSQLKAWAVDRAERVLLGSDQPFHVDDVLKVADRLLEYAYTPSEDFDDAAKNLFEIVYNSKSDMSVKIDFIVDQINDIKTQRLSEGLDKQPVEAVA